MWTRKELKDKAKVSFRANYWKAVLVALILAAVGVGFSGYQSAANPAVMSSANQNAASSYSGEDVNVDITGDKVTVDVDDNNGGKVHVTMDADDVENIEGVLDDVIHDDYGSSHSSSWAGPAAAIAGLSVALLVLALIAVAVAVYAFVINPLEVGAQRFFLRNLNQRAEVKEVAYAYDNCYLESVKTLFLRDLFIILWSLLLIIPGIYKSYEYRMIPYLMADDPTMTKDRAFVESKRMMEGQKWNAFVLDLSFLGWNILSALTLGILGVFYVGPYQAQTNAALYEKLRYGLPAPAPAQPQAAYPGPVPVQPGYNAAPEQPVGYTAPQQYTQPMQYAQATQPMQTAEPVQPTAPMPESEQAAVANSQAQVAPVIVPASQPPVPPFAAVGYVAEELASVDGFEAAEEPAGLDNAEVAEEPVVPNGTEAAGEPEDSETDAADDSTEA